MIARGLHAYRNLALMGCCTPPFTSTEDHRRSKYSEAKIMVDTISIVKNILRYLNSSSWIDSSTIQMMLIVISEIINKETTRETKSSESVTSSIW